MSKKEKIDEHIRKIMKSVVELRDLTGSSLKDGTIIVLEGEDEDEDEVHFNFGDFHHISKIHKLRASITGGEPTINVKLTVIRKDGTEETFE